VPESLTAQRGHLPALRPRPAHRQPIATRRVHSTRRPPPRPPAKAPASTARLWIAPGMAALLLTAATLGGIWFLMQKEHAAVKTLLAQVRAVKDSDAEQYEKAIASGQFLEILLAEGSLPNTWAETNEVRKLGLEGSATFALLRVIQENQNSTSKKDLLICGRALEALGRIGLAAKETIPILEDLRKHRAVAVSVKTSVAFEAIQDEIEGAELQVKDPVSFEDRQRLQGSWKPASFVATGMPLRKPENNATMTFTGGRIRIDVESLHNSGGYHLNAAKRAKEIDLVDTKDQENLYGVYSLEGNTLNLCLGEDATEKPEYPK